MQYVLSQLEAENLDNLYNNYRSLELTALNCHALDLFLLGLQDDNNN